MSACPPSLTLLCLASYRCCHPCFFSRIDPQASADFKSKFDVKSQGGGKYVLVTKKVFDREAQKTYSVPIRIADNQVSKYHLVRNGFIITWILHQFFIFYNKVNSRLK